MSLPAVEPMFGDEGRYSARARTHTHTHTHTRGIKPTGVRNLGQGDVQSVSLDVAMRVLAGI